MTAFFYLAAIVLLLTVAASLLRIHLGPTRADRMMSAQLIGTSGVGIILLLAAAQDDGAILDAALILALLAAFAAVAFVKTSSADGAGDREEEDE
ncbi:MAG: monovalent cation/H+ antiporter complex subunit F [Pigmentiphaga sp.]|nr:monovalent cation/H+ antiporter complex subunit F [Pigmentiphaga sp.]